MTIMAPAFAGDYAGHLIQGIVTDTLSDAFKSYVESVEIVYDNIYDRKLTGFSDTKYLQNATDATKASGEISITLVGDLPDWLMQQLVQLAKGCMGSGIALLFNNNSLTLCKNPCTKKRLRVP